jgi:hypothetical protein
MIRFNVCEVCNRPRGKFGEKTMNHTACMQLLFDIGKFKKTKPKKYKPYTKEKIESILKSVGE